MADLLGQLGPGQLAGVAFQNLKLRYKRGMLSWWTCHQSYEPSQTG